MSSSSAGALADMMGGGPSRSQERLVALLSQAHRADNVEVRIELLQQAAELLLYHSSPNDQRIDEFLDTFLAFHLDRLAPIRRFCAHFIHNLCYTRSRYSLRCLSTLCTLLSDNDTVVVRLALEAARTIYPRAIYWTSVVQKQAQQQLTLLMMSADADGQSAAMRHQQQQSAAMARESSQLLRAVLAGIAQHSTRGRHGIFIAAVEALTIVALCQSSLEGSGTDTSGRALGMKSQAYLEEYGASCLDDLKLSSPLQGDTGDGSFQGGLDEAQLQRESEQIVLALCKMMLTVSHGEEWDEASGGSPEEDKRTEAEMVAVVRALGVLGAERASANAQGVMLTFASGFEDLMEVASRTGRLRSALIQAVRRMLASPQCTQWQPRLAAILQQLLQAAGQIEQETLDQMVFEAEQARLREVFAGEDPTRPEPHAKRRKMESEKALPGIDMVDEEHVVAVCAVRATGSNDSLTRMVQKLLGRLPRKLINAEATVQRVVRVTDADGFSNTATVQRKLDRAKALFSRSAQDFLQDRPQDDDEVTEEEPREVVEPVEQRDLGPVSPAAAKESRDELARAIFSSVLKALSRYESSALSSPCFDKTATRWFKDTYSGLVAHLCNTLGKEAEFTRTAMQYFLDRTRPPSEAEQQHVLLVDCGVVDLMASRHALAAASKGDSSLTYEAAAEILLTEIKRRDYLTIHDVRILLLALPAVPACFVEFLWHAASSTTEPVKQRRQALLALRAVMVERVGAERSVPGAPTTRQSAFLGLARTSALGPSEDIRADATKLILAPDKFYNPASLPAIDKSTCEGTWRWPYPGEAEDEHMSDPSKAEDWVDADWLMTSGLEEYAFGCMLAASARQLDEFAPFIAKAVRGDSTGEDEPATTRTSLFLQMLAKRPSLLHSVVACEDLHPSLAPYLTAQVPVAVVEAMKGEQTKSDSSKADVSAAQLVDPAVLASVKEVVERGCEPPQAIEMLAGIFYEMMKAPELIVRRRLSSQDYVNAVTGKMGEEEATAAVDSRLLLAVLPGCPHDAVLSSYLFTVVNEEKMYTKDNLAFTTLGMGRLLEKSTGARVTAIEVIGALLEMKEVPTARLMKMMNLVFDLRGRSYEVQHLGLVLQSIAERLELNQEPPPLFMRVTLQLAQNEAVMAKFITTEVVSKLLRNSSIWDINSNWKGFRMTVLSLLKAFGEDEQCRFLLCQELCSSVSEGCLPGEKLRELSEFKGEVKTALREFLQHPDNSESYTEAKEELRLI
ncbi:hypothetical protein FOL46_000924 [Perkinsus olseni]|uniref:Symplekin C-terminal domain-containing protein n=1 Tax=Perkinsus olseni TaxID=32597 RepID=A0A7J6MFH1_PEROL|nr:hypothetical protein FOL46_000924 [Perkinsus olseni]